MMKLNNLFKRSLKRLTRSLPLGGAWDVIFHYSNFIIDHGRLPERCPRRFNDILFQYKVSGELLKPDRIFTTDKFYVKKFIADRIGEKYNVPTVGYLTTASDIHNFHYPDTCFIKATHASAENIYRKNGEPLDYHKIGMMLQLNYYNSFRESNYKSLTPAVIVERPVFNGANFFEARMFCMNGKLKFTVCNTGDKFTGFKRRIYDREWTDLGISIGSDISQVIVDVPIYYKEMVEKAEILADGFGLVRVDVFCGDSGFLFGEITHCHASASQRFNPESMEHIITEILWCQN